MSISVKRTSQNRMFAYFLVFSLLALVTAAATVFLGEKFAEARDVERIGDITVIRNALELYHVDHGAYPNIPAATSADASWDALGEQLRPYLSSLPRDPVNTPSGERPIEGFVYGYFSAQKQQDGNEMKGPGNYVITFRLEKPLSAFRHSTVNTGVVTARGISAPIELTGSAGVYVVRAP